MVRKLRMGMVGGGRGAFIGAVHRMAAQLDGKIEFVCGAFSRDPRQSIASGRDLHLPAARCYGTWREMFAKEAKLPAGERMDFVSVVATNDAHYDVAMAALNAGVHVVCEKPMTTSLDRARKMARKVEQTGLLFCLTHNYTGYPMVKEARSLVAGGRMGAVRRVVVEYPQGWLATRLEDTGQKQAAWRCDPKRAGVSNCMGDIGTHCENLAEYIAGVRIASLCADLTKFLPGRALEDDGSVLLRFQGGAKGILWASQIAIGCENDLRIRVFCEKGAIEWHQQEPNTLIVDWGGDQPRQLLRTATGPIRAGAGNTRLPAGHPEGYIEAFANVYTHFAGALTRRLAGKPVKPAGADYPDVYDGVRGVAFLDAVVKSKGQWITMAAG